MNREYQQKWLAVWFFLLTFTWGSWMTTGSLLADVNYFSKTYGGSQSEEGCSVFQTADGGFAVTGYTGSFGMGGDDAWTLKLDDTGDIEWEKTYGGKYDDFADLVIEKPGGGYMLVGSTNSYGAGLYDVWVVALTDNGTVQWQKTYGGTRDDMAVTIQATLDGGFIVAGETRSFGAGDWDIWLIKLASDGTVQWQKTYGGKNLETTSADPIQQTSDGGYILAGRTDSYGAGDLDVWVLKLDANGAIQWQNTYGGHKYERARAVRQTKDGGFVVVGYTKSFGAGDFDIWALKLNGSGKVQWQQTSAGSTEDVACAVRPSIDGGYVVAGLKERHGVNWDFWLLKSNADGIIPGCALIKTAHVTIGSTVVVAVTSSASAHASKAVVKTISSFPKHSTAYVGTQCFQTVECFYPVRVASPVPWYFNTLAEALESAESGDIIQARALTFVGDLDLDSSTSLAIEGGHDCDYTSAVGMTSVSGAV